MGKHVFQFCPKLGHELIRLVSRATVSIVERFLQVRLALQNVGRIISCSRRSLGGFQAVSGLSVYSEDIGGIISQIGRVEYLRPGFQGYVTRSGSCHPGIRPRFHGK